LEWAGAENKFQKDAAREEKNNLAPEKAAPSCGGKLINCSIYELK
jgi:hypothetical protein